MTRKGFIYTVYTYDSFNRKGLDTWLMGQTDKDCHPIGREIRKSWKRIAHGDKVINRLNPYLVYHNLLCYTT